MTTTVGFKPTCLTLRPIFTLQLPRVARAGLPLLSLHNPVARAARAPGGTLHSVAFLTRLPLRGAAAGQTTFGKSLQDLKIFDAI